MKKAVFFSTISALIICCSCSNDEPAPTTPEEKIEKRHDIELSRAESEIINAQNEFAFTLFAKMVDEQPAQNVVAAPFSMSSALSILANGADGAELQDIIDALGVNNLQNLNEINARLISELTTIDKLVSFKSANSIWANPDVTFYNDFITTVNRYYNAETFNADFSTQSGVNAFNTWCSQKTDGMITDMMTTPSDDIKLAIANANLFKGAWTYKFNPSDTKQGIFYSSIGEQTVEMMTRKNGYQESDVSEGVTMARLTFGNGAFRITFILPYGENTLSDILISLDCAKWRKYCAAKFSDGRDSIFIPKFKAAYRNHNFISIMKKWMPDAFGCDNCYRKIGSHSNGNEMLVTDVKHDVAIEFDETGTSAAAVTEFDMIFGSTGSHHDPNFRVNRPFLFVIDEVSTGAVLFIGSINRI